ncbi:hypothetical protein AMD27_05465 [Acinetobacter sp. TGL-Y2]|uniref:hypothetical protein n=1 Tax=Acinetobacter sp. TGL-Y2 TaxID=1407071 RepID=UPI0007A6540C|nr:hypothetical protein [Acinetobacter sp. TGL-Y2]AMW78384.1 hypothetical protein AMD27_05465 [Acinetobacter sp. TGL-Y2]
MTFIIAIQLNDSIIVAADNKEVILKEDQLNEPIAHSTSKIHSWDNGIITGTGESYVINRCIALFEEFAQSELASLPDYLELSRHIREHEIGKDHFQVQNTKLLCSSYSERGAQLYKIEQINDQQSYTMTAIEPMDMTVWMFNPNVETITADLKNLYLDLKDYSAFTNQVDWMNHYINRIAPIYQKQSQVDSLMSQSFDIFFQSKDEYVFGHIPNTQNTAIELKEIYPDSASI